MEILLARKMKKHKRVHVFVIEGEKHKKKVLRVTEICEEKKKDFGTLIPHPSGIEKSKSMSFILATHVREERGSMR